MFPHRVFMWIQYMCIIENNCQFSAETIISPVKYPQVHVLSTAQSLWLQISSEPSCWDPVNAEPADCQQTSFHSGENREGFWCIVTTLLWRALCPQHTAGLGFTVTPTLPDLCWDGTWWIMPPSSKTAPCLDFSLGPKLPEFNVLSTLVF